MYKPIQLPILLNESSKYFAHSEVVMHSKNGFITSTDEFISISNEVDSLEEIILSNGTIDLGFDFDNKWIGYGGICETEFYFRTALPYRNFAIRLKPGAFHQLTGIDVTDFMKVGYVDLKEVDPDFDEDVFFLWIMRKPKNFSSLMSRSYQKVKHQINSQVCLTNSLTHLHAPLETSMITSTYLHDNVSDYF